MKSDTITILSRPLALILSSSRTVTVFAPCHPLPHFRRQRHPTRLSSTVKSQGVAEETEAEIERTVEAHTVEMPRVQNSIGLYAHITGIKWNYETEGEIMAGWLLPRGGASPAGCAGGRDGATVEGFQFDAAGKGDFEVANKLWDIIDGRARAMVEA